MLPPHDVGAAVAEARRTVTEFGFKAMFMRPNPINGRYWHHPSYDPLWAELERLGVPIGFHEGGSGEMPYIEQTGKRFDKGIMGHVVSHSLEMMQACVSMCMGGVLERHPRLRVAFLEGNCGWAPWLLWRMDEHIEWRGAVESPDLTRRPSEYFKRQCWVSIECDEEPGVHAAETLADNIVFSTDYPHGDSKYPRATEQFLQLPLPEAAARKILWDNWARLYGF
jgi:predicted TIM-barrel fold metal-dependent hydrolase